MNLGTLIGWIAGIWIGLGIFYWIAKDKMITNSEAFYLSFPVCIVSALIGGIIGTLLY